MITFISIWILLVVAVRVYRVAKDTSSPAWACVGELLIYAIAIYAIVLLHEAAKYSQ